MQTNLSSVPFFLALFICIIISAFGVNNPDNIEFRSDYTYFPKLGLWVKVHPQPVNTLTAAFTCQHEGADSLLPLVKEILTRIGFQRNNTYKIRERPNSNISDDKIDTVKRIILQIVSRMNWNAPPSACLISNNEEGVTWNDTCSEPFPFMCYKKLLEKEKMNECGTIDDRYEPQWPPVKPMHCHKYHYDPATWQQAMRICRAEGGYLAVINSVDEALSLNETFNFYRPLFNETVPVFVGYREWGMADGSWWTVHGQTLKEAGFEHWCSGCPEKERTIKTSKDLYCGGFANGWLEDIPCDKPHCFICEKRADSLTNKNKPYSY